LETAEGGVATQNRKTLQTIGKSGEQRGGEHSFIEVRKEFGRAAINKKSVGVNCELKV